MINIIGVAEAVHHNTLYLDTARMGQMSSLAYHASIDLARFASEHSCTLYFTQLLQEGFSSWPSALRTQYPGLSNWEGVYKFRENLRQLAEASRKSEVLFASRPASLMKIAARLLARSCRHVLITDTCWPAYKKILGRELRRTATQFTVVPIRHMLLRESISPSALVKYITGEFIRMKCDGLFLPLVDNLGIRLPIEALVERIRQQTELRFVVVDGAQAIGHVPLRLEANYCDFLLAGSHKWLRAFYPMGIGFFGNPLSQGDISSSLKSWIRSGNVDDPLLPFSDELTTGIERPFGETVQIAPLLVANAATSQILSKNLRRSHRTHSNRDLVTRIAKQADWKPVAPHRSMTTQILLFENQIYRSMRVAGRDLRRKLYAHGVAATAFQNGLLRLSLPDIRLDKIACHSLISALQRRPLNLHATGAMPSPSELY